MQMAHMHKPDWVHWHKPNWHTLGIHLDHIVHDPRFWAALALAILLGLMILTTIFAKSQGQMTPTYPYPVYPYVA